MDILVRSLDGSSIASLKVQPSDTAGFILEELQAFGHRLTLGASILDNSSTLLKCGVEQDAELYLVRVHPEGALDLRSNSNLGSQGLQALLEGLPESVLLRHLDLGGCGINLQEDAECIRSLLQRTPALQSLHLSYNKFNADGVQFIADNIPRGNALRSIDLSCCSLQGPNAGKAVGSLCGRATVLEQLNLSHNREFACEGVQAFAVECPEASRIKLLNLSRCGLEGIDAVKAVLRLLEKFETIEELNIDSQPKLSIDACLEVAREKSQVLCLRTISLGSCGLLNVAGGKAAASMVGICPSLEELLVADNLLGTAGLDALVQELSSNSNITKISLQTCGLNEHDPVGNAGNSLACLLKALPELERLVLSGNWQLGQAGIAALCETLHVDSKLQLVDLSSGAIAGADGGKCLAALVSRLTQLNCLMLDRNQGLGAEGLDAFVAALGPSSCLALKRIMLSRCGFAGTGGGRAIASLMQKIPFLEHVSIAHNINLGSVGTFALAEALPEKTCLKRLDAGGCGLVGPEGGRAAAALVCRLATLRVLELKDNDDLGSEGATALVLALPKTMNLRSLDIGRCGLVGTGGACAVAGAFRRAPNLRTLRIQGNRDIGAAGIMALAAAIPDQADLQEVDLSCVGLEGREGGLAAAALLRRCVR